MQRRTTLKALGGSALGTSAFGGVAFGGGASDDDTDNGTPDDDTACLILVDFETEREYTTGDPESYEVEYEGDRQIVVTGEITYTEDCGQDVEFDGIVPVEHGNLAVFTFTEGDNECFDAITTVRYRAVFEYCEDEVSHLFVKHRGNISDR